MVLGPADAASSRQRELHKELSSLRVVLENVTEKTPGSNTTLLQWKVPVCLSVCLPACLPACLSVCLSVISHSTSVDI